jgi:hypothetical protein
MDIDGDGGRSEFELRGQRRGTESDKGTAANSLSGHAPGLKRFWLVCGLGHEITKLGVKLVCEPWSRHALLVAYVSSMSETDLRMNDKPHQFRRLSIRWSSSSNDMPRNRRGQQLGKPLTAHTSWVNPPVAQATSVSNLNQLSSQELLTDPLTDPPMPI